MKFWLDWDTHKVALSVFGAISSLFGFLILLSRLPKGVAAGIVITLLLLIFYLLIYCLAKEDPYPDNHHGEDF